MIRRFFKSLLRTLGAWFRRPARAPEGRLFKGSHSAFGRSFSLVQLTAGRRPYLLYLPRTYSASKRMPMLVMLHGCRQDAETFAAVTRMNGIADRDNFLVLYPEQRRLANSFRCWNWFAGSAQAGAGEAAILADMIRALADEHGVDSGRIYIAGLSAGAAMANNLAVSHADLFAACALHSGLVYGAATSSHQAIRAMRDGARGDAGEKARQAFLKSRGRTEHMPALVIQGDADEVVNPVNAEQLAEQFKVWNELLADDRQQPVRFSEHTSNSAGNHAAYAYSISDLESDGHVLVREILISGLGHAWSGGPEEHDYSDQHGPDASELICDFFAEHGLRDGAPQTNRS